MKKTTSLIFSYLLLFAFNSIYAQVQNGGYVMFPDAKLWGSAYKPRLCFFSTNNDSIIDTQIVLCYISSTDYKNFDNNSLLLFKIHREDNTDTNIVCRIDPISSIHKEYDNSYSSAGINNFYKTYSTYNINDSAFINEYINNEEIKITKIRVLFSNGSYEDFDIKRRYIDEFNSDFKNSYRYSIIGLKKKMNNIKNYEEGF